MFINSRKRRRTPIEQTLLYPDLPSTLILPPGVTNNRVTGRTEGYPTGNQPRLPLNTGGVTHFVATRTEAVAAFNAVAASGTNDIIVFTQTINMPAGFQLPARQNDTLMCDITSDIYYSGNFEATGSMRARPEYTYRYWERELTAGSTALGAIRTPDNGTNNSSGYRFIGLGLRNAAGQPSYMVNFINFGVISGQQTARTRVPLRNRIEKCFYDGTGIGIKGFCYLGSALSSMCDNWIRRAWSPQWTDVATMLSWNTWGYNVVENNWMDSSGENWFIGGGDQSIGEDNKSWVFRDNSIVKDIDYYASFGTTVYIKNLGEIKQCTGLVIENNYHANSRQLNPGGQNGASLVYKFEDYGSPGHDGTSGHVLFRGNIVDNVSQCLQMQGQRDTDTSPEPVVNFLQEIHVIDNLFRGYNDTPFHESGADVVIVTASMGFANFDHNTVVSVNNPGGTLVTFSGSTVVDKFHMKNSIVPYGQYGFTGNGTGGNAAFTAHTLLKDVSENLIVGGVATNNPLNNEYGKTNSDLFEAADITSGRYKVKDSYPTRLASDGWAKGCDVDTVLSRVGPLIEAP
jgi:hypothetical protein